MVRILHERMAEIEEQILMAVVLRVADPASIPTNSDPKEIHECHAPIGFREIFTSSVYRRKSPLEPHREQVVNE